MNNREILTTAQMRAIESAAIDSGAVTGLELMERAGAAVVDAILVRWPNVGRAVILCGPGNNGGDGFVIARLLKRHGVRVATLFTGDRDRLSPDARANHDLWQQMPGEDDGWFRDSARSPEAFETGIRDSDLVVDALLGTGGSRPLPQDWARLLSSAAASGRPIVAVDALSGLDLDTGRYATEGGDGLPAAAALTVSFLRPKVGHKLEDGPARSGELLVSDIGLEDHLRSYFAGPLDRHDPLPAYRLTWPLPALAKTSGHKFDHGHALVLAGPAGRGGAARLAARAALRSGAGMVTLACPQDAISENAAALPDAIMLRALDTTDDLRTLLTDRRINAICAGPGLGGERAAQLLPVLAEDAGGTKPFMWIGSEQVRYDHAERKGRKTVLDADALTAGATQAQDFLGGLHWNVVLTPHDGEFARLFPDLGARLGQGEPGFSRLDAAEAAAARAAAIVLLKGPSTVISASVPRLRGQPLTAGWVNAAAGPDAVPWLATAGAGDVLAGIITGLMARGLPSYDAAAAGAWLHAAAARRFGPGLIADDLPDEIPGVFRDLGL